MVGDTGENWDMGELGQWRTGTGENCDTSSFCQSGSKYVFLLSYYRSYPRGLEGIKNIEWVSTSFN